ncbi:MAG: radical SAM protein [Candidatus Helarchaeota archaeon]
MAAPLFIDDLLECDPPKFKQYQDAALKLKLINFNRSLWFYAPSLLHYSIDQYHNSDQNQFIPISITGSKCYLQCDHCKSKILDSMYPAESPAKLYSLVKDFVLNKNCNGILISGGSSLNGSVPFLNYIPTINTIKSEFDITVILHSGLITHDLALALSKVNIDAVLLDIIGHDDTIHRIYHLNKNVSHFANSLRLLSSFNIPFVPHIILGLDYGEFKGELNALKLIKNYNPNALVLVVLMPLDDTPMSLTNPASPDKLARYFTLARFMFPNIPILLGCARPKGDHKVKTDILAIQSGINGIAYPSQEAVDFALENGFSIQFSNLCCSLIFHHL